MARPFMLLLAVGIVLLCTVAPTAALAKDGHGEVRVAGVCSSGTRSELRLRSSDHGIELRFELGGSRAGAVWRVVLVHERRVAWKGVVKATRPSGSFEVRRTVRDLPGADAVTVNAWGPRGIVCRAAVTLPDA